MAVIIGLSAPVAISFSMDFPENIGAIELTNAMWQILPEPVVAVSVGPDDRIWYELRYPPHFEVVPRVRQVIEQQFKANSPQIFGAHPVLFEKSGRVWFNTAFDRMLMGYDGRDWVEHPASGGGIFTGSCPNHGCRMRWCSWNLDLDGTLFFPDLRGVHTFDGHAWDYHLMATTNAARVGPIILRREPGKESILAVVMGNSASLWRWADRDWTAIDLKSDQVKNILPSTTNGVWLLMNDDTLRFHPFAAAEAAVNWEAQVARLKAAKDGEERQAIADEIIQHEAPVRADVEHAMDRTFDPDVLRQLIRMWDVQTPDRSSTKAGPYEIGKAYLLRFDGTTGQCYLRVENVRKEGNPIGMGLLVLNGASGPAFFPGEELLPGWRASAPQDSGTIVIPDGRAFWVQAGGGTYLFDVSVGRFVDHVPTPGFGWVHAVTRDGTVFVGARAPDFNYATVGVYKPGAPKPDKAQETMNLLQANAYPLQRDRPATCVDSAGVVWAALEDGGMSRFDGGQWRQVPELRADRNFRLLIPGAAQRVIGQSQTDFFYWTPESFSRHVSFTELVATHHEDIARYFGSAVDEVRSYGTFVTGIVADKAGNIWLLESRRLSVWVDGQWLSATAALLTAGSRAGEVEYINTMGGREGVYVTDFMPRHDRGTSHFGKIENGRPTFTRAPHAARVRFARGMSVRDPHDALWISSSIGGAGGTCDWISDQLALRLAGTGVVEEAKNTGWAKLCDKAGNVWLGEIRGEQPGDCRIWRNGKITGPVKVSTREERIPRLLCDAPGSVYAWTGAGLQHLTANGGTNSSDFKIDCQYTIAGVQGDPEKLCYTEQGWMVWVAGHQLHLVRLPKGEEK